MAGEPWSGMRQDRRRIDRAPLAPHHEGGDDADLGADPVLTDGYLHHTGAVDQRGLDLERRNAIAAGVHDVVGAAMRPEIAIAVERREVAPGKPVAAEGACLLLGATPIAEHQSG